MDDTQPHREWVELALNRHGPALTRYAASLVGEDDLARDIVQDTFLRLCDMSPEELGDRLPAWLFTVCRHRALDHLRKSHRMKPLSDEDLEQQASPLPSPAAAAEQDDALAVVRRLMDALPANQQEVVRLKFQGGLSYEQISRVTSLSVTNVGFLLHTALKTLRTRAARSL